MSCHFIVGVHVTDHTKHAGEVQKVFTEYACHIRTRLGLHEVSEQVCSPNGLILLEVLCDEPTCQKLTDRLKAISGVEVQHMAFGR